MRKTRTHSQLRPHHRHAVESASHYRLLHGEAVAIGIIGAGLIEEQLGFAKQPHLSRIKAILENWAFPQPYRRI